MSWWWNNEVGVGCEKFTIHKRTIDEILKFKKILHKKRWEAWVIGSEPKERLILCYCCTSEIDHYPTSVDELNACGDEVLHKRVFHFYPPNRLSEGRAMRSRAD
ncbi:hypothetical protein TPS_07164 [Trichinella pseudospiralis]